MDYTAALRCARLSKEVYQSFSLEPRFSIGASLVPELIEIAVTDTQLAIIPDSNQDIGYIVFRGSNAEQDWLTNFDFNQRSYEWSNRSKAAYREAVSDAAVQVIRNREMTYPSAYAPTSKPIKMHSGFVNAYLSARDRVHDAVKRSGLSRWLITGHSLGGALANLCGLDLQYNFSPDVVPQVYTFGAPKVGNGAFVDSYNERVPDTFRFVYGNDLVSGLPRWWQGYRHVSEKITLEGRFNWRIFSGSFKDHRIDNYVSAINKLASQD